MLFHGFSRRWLPVLCHGLAFPDGVTSWLFLFVKGILVIIVVGTTVIGVVVILFFTTTVTKIEFLGMGSSFCFSARYGCWPSSMNDHRIHFIFFLVITLVVTCDTRRRHRMYLLGILRRLDVVTATIPWKFCIVYLYHATGPLYAIFSGVDKTAATSSSTASVVVVPLHDGGKLGLGFEYYWV